MSDPSCEALEAVRVHCGLEVHEVVPLPGGYDPWAQSWCARSDRGRLIIRADRSTCPQTAAWMAEVMQRAHQSGVPCPLPLPTADGAVSLAVGEHTLTVYPFVDAFELDRDDPGQLHAAGATLAVLHGAVAGHLQDRPFPSPWHERFWPGESDGPALRDPELDAWQRSFTNAPDPNLTPGAVHGDFWSGNILCADARVAAVIDWGEARVDVLARELAWATWEFGHDPSSRMLDIDRARIFLRRFAP